MSNASAFIPAQAAGGAGGRWYSEPDKLPRFLAPSGLALKYATGAQYTSTSANFFTTGAIYGATADVAAADTYVTVCDIAGAGTMYNVVGPQLSNTAAGTSCTVRITKDGTPTTIVWAADTTVAATDRLVIGGLGVSGQAITDTNPSALSPGSYLDSGFVQLEGGLPYPASASLIAPYWFELLNLNSLRFSTSLKVEVKGSHLGAAGVPRSCLATYLLDL